LASLKVFEVLNAASVLIGPLRTRAAVTVSKFAGGGKFAPRPRRKVFSPGKNYPWKGDNRIVIMWQEEYPFGRRRRAMFDRYDPARQIDWCKLLCCRPHP
jgi:hypothetical protein